MLQVKGPLLTIDLDSRETRTASIDDVLSSFIGGRGVATKLAHDRIPFDADPFGPGNRLYFTTGPMQTSRMSFTGRMNATALSPLTNGLVSSNAGGFLSRNFADTGYAGVEISGESDELLVLHVTDETVEFEEVPELAEATVPEVTEHVEDRGLDEEHIAAIGPGGENQVRFASIMSTESRAFGRGGLGAVLGAKGVKAVTFEGDSRREGEIDDVFSDIHREASTMDHIMKQQGTTAVADLANTVQGMPTRYFSERQFEGIEGINGAAVQDRKYKKGTCSACAFACKLPTRDEERGVETEGPEFETLMAFGSNCSVDDIVDVMQSNELCDRFGLDTISAGNTVAAYLASEDAFGDTELIHKMVEKIAFREGIGDTLAEGIARCHDELGVENWTVKGLDFAAHEGRALNGQALAYAVSNRGADHMYSTFYVWEYPLVGSDEALDPQGVTGKAEAVARQENVRALEDCGVICRFSREMVSQQPDRLEALLDAPLEDLLDVGRRVVELERHFNNERGFDRSDDTVPYADQIDDFETGLDEYYEVRGWNDDGTVPTENLDSSAAAD